MGVFPQVQRGEQQSAAAPVGVTSRQLVQAASQNTHSPHAHPSNRFEEFTMAPDSVDLASYSLRSTSSRQGPFVPSPHTSRMQQQRARQTMLAILAARNSEEAKLEQDESKEVFDSPPVSVATILRQPSPFVTTTHTWHQQ